MGWVPVSIAAKGNDGAATGPVSSGPVLTLDYTGQASNDILIADFMYFVPLISPEPVVVSESPTNTLRVRVKSIREEKKPDRFSTTLAFDISGEGFRHYAIDQAENFRRSRRLASGRVLERQLDYIRYEGPGRGRLEIEGSIDGAEKVVTAVRLHFDGPGSAASPVVIGMKDVRPVEGGLKFENELVVRIATLEFTRGGQPPRMAVTVDSVKRKEAGNNLFQNLKGQVVGLVANMLIDPLVIQPVGNDTMLNFGRALLDREPTFAFPAARNLKPAPPPGG